MASVSAAMASVAAVPVAADGEARQQRHVD
ncbi:hypothetical protein FHS42_004711 [Streptomyces zagrosensis]|uniref:Uncharacterized protein n=1 Tax=Streptomyces zagrosensis TaxID=1042984 RepID=A0A7W9QCA6_9ACTN|nr:hypothetical protein [Streptomyces zagrosensis]